MFELGPDVPCRTTSSAARTVGEMFWLRAARSASRPALYHKPHPETGRWAEITWRDFYERAACHAQGLLDLGLAPGDRVAILGPTQPAWCFADMGAQLAGMVSFGIYPKQAPSQVRYLLEHSEAQAVFVADAQELETVIEAADGLDALQAIVPWTEKLHGTFRDRDPRVTPPSRMAGERIGEARYREIQAGIDPDDTAILVYTSGTTGPPKGAMISHRNILSLITAAQDATPMDQSDLSLSFLPMAHVAERILGFYNRAACGVPTAYATSTGTVLQELQEVRPTLFGSVPRIFEKAYARIQNQLDGRPAAVRRLFSWAEGVGRARLPYLEANQPVPTSLSLRYALAERLAFRRIQGAFGGRVRRLITGAAPTPLEILKFFWAAGLPIYEVYGMTESTVVTHANRPDALRLGTVGQCIRPGECRIAEDGEVLIKAPWVFKGYFKNEAATAETVVDGWLHTGDIGVVDDDGYLRITDRKKHLIITAGGKNLAPASIEKALKTSDPLISQVHPHGDQRPYVSALITASPVETLEWGVDKGLITGDELETHQRELLANPASRSDALNAAMGKVVAHPEFVERIRAAVRRGNEGLARVEQVKRFVLLDRDFSQEGGELTPTLKVKRKAIEKKYAKTFDAIYVDRTFALEP
jgi:long-chain acyl-CoA synthetase